jgi:hypothetical protein
MPCQFCQSVTHALKQCDSEIAQNMFMDVILFHMAHPFNISQQITYLERYTNRQLAVICSKLQTYISGTKKQLIFYIIQKLFISRTVSNMLSTLTVNNMADIDIEYDTLYPLATQNDLLYTRLIRMLDSFYFDAYRVRRNGLSSSYYAVRVRISLGLNPVVNESKNHLKKLDFQIEIDNSLLVKDCMICCDEKPNARLGCGHEYCVECIFGSAKVRTKTFITCAMCRAEITSVQVGADEIKVDLLQKILTV